ncbi:MAG: DUF72 domain-containing protein [Candidatus Thorarchaeota archaeon]
MSRKGLHIGTSGWSYESDWKDVFYYSGKSLLQQYLAIFDTAEINSTFYALPQPNFVKHLASLKEDKFFTAKLPKKVTHDSRMNLLGEGGESLKSFFSLMSPIQNKIAALLIQLPPWDISKMADLEAFLSQLDSSFRYAIEFRDESWMSQKTSRLLEDYGVAYVIVDEPKLPIDPRVTTDFAYVRWHGHGVNPWYNYLYSEQELEAWRPRLEDIMSRTESVLGYWNNHFSGNAPFNALQMLQLMGKINPRQQQKLDLMLRHMSFTQTKLDDF